MRKSLALSLFACLLFGSVLAGPFLIVGGGPQTADAIVVIGGDHKLERVGRAVELYQQGYAPVVIISAGTLVSEGDEQLAEAEVMRRQALALGLPEAVLLVENKSKSTFQNAYYTKTICQQHGFQSVLLVTSTYHSRRARRIFRDVFGADISLSVQPSAQTSCSLCWWLHPDQATVVLYEYYNWGRYWLGIRLPSEAPPNNSLQRLHHWAN